MARRGDLTTTRRSRETTRRHAAGEGWGEEIEYPLSPVYADEEGDGTSATVVHKVTLEGLLSGEPKHVNVHKPGPGEPPPVTCANLNEAR